ncbi:glycosyl transferase [Blastopirellula marina]|uniref:Glycosyl transferase n=2 Tax=Blastopirellula marina TaxID=124 RepID=A0A2S8GNH6_9BACT|nr:glycosyl transferase [Blastopirellula marina]
MGRAFALLSLPAANAEGKDAPVYLAAKRAIDVVGSLLAILVATPVMLAAAILIKTCDWGPVFYVHRRVGRGGQEFTCLKFRSMHVNADAALQELMSQNQHSDHRTFKMQDDPRITWIGKWLRKTSLDELPQLFNVLSGQMSLVGPRPPVPSEVSKYSERDLRRLAVKPGLTCIWQVSGRSRIPFPQQLEMDIEYIESRSLWLDLKLLARTVPAVLTADGAY